MNNLRKSFLLDPEIIFLNHGSFGACPIPVFEEYQKWQNELERQPVAFLGRRITELMLESRTRLSEYLNVPADTLVYFPNPTTAINMVARNLDLEPGDEILSTDHEYGAMDRTWRFICHQTGAKYIQTKIPIPIKRKEEIIERIWKNVSDQTKVIFISHITSPTALIFPIEEICELARQAGILSIVDGAHAPGHIALNLADIGADLYTGACHKWLCAPKGAAFLYAHPDIQPSLMPLVVSWGYESQNPSESQYIDYHEWQGTRDIAAFLSVPAAIDFQNTHAWDHVRLACHALASQTRQRIEELSQQVSICPDSDAWFNQMFTTRLPERVNLEQFKTRLYDEFRIEVPVIHWNEEKFMRVSFQGYNDSHDADCLIDALTALLED